MTDLIIFFLGCATASGLISILDRLKKKKVEYTMTYIYVNDLDNLTKEVQDKVNELIESGADWKVIEID